METEYFIDIIGYEEKYQISNYGTIKRKKHTVISQKQKYIYNEIVLTHKFTKSKYRFIALSINDKKKQFYIHYLVFIHFIKEEILPGNQIDHDDNDKDNNYYLNLIQRTPRINSSKDRKPLSGLTGVTQINGRFKANIRISGKGYHLGTFDTALQASDAYKKAVINIKQ